MQKSLIDKIFLPIFLSIFLISTLLVYYLYQQYLLREKQLSTNLNHPNTSANQVPSENTIDGWKTYTNSVWNFSFQYPADWNLSTSNEEDSHKISDRYLVSLSTESSDATFPPYAGSAGFDVAVVAQTNQSLDEYIAANYESIVGDSSDVSSTPSTIGGKKAISVYGCSIGCHTNIYLNNNGFIYSLHQFVGDQTQPGTDSNMEKVINSFRFK